MIAIRVVVITVTVMSVACGSRGAPTAPTASVGAQVTGVQPTVARVFPNVVSTAGAWGTIIGTGFQPGATIRIGVTVIPGIVRDSTTIEFGSSGQHAPGTVDLTIINPEGGEATLVGGYTYAPPDSFDADGAWNGYADARNDYTIEMHFTIRDDVLVSLSCGATSLVTAPLPLKMAGGGFSFSGANGLAISGMLLSQSTSSGSVNAPECGDGRWWANKSDGEPPMAAPTRFAARIRSR